MKVSFAILLYFFSKINAFDYVQFNLTILNQYSTQIFNINDNLECVKQMKIVLLDAQTLQMWALKMLDATAKLQSGILYGNIESLGNYDECLTIDSFSNNNRIIGQYCTAHIKFTDNTHQLVMKQLETLHAPKFIGQNLNNLKSFMKIGWGICIPAVCSSNDMQKMWNFIEERYEMKYHIAFQEDRCYSNMLKTKYTTLEIITLSIFGVIGGIVVLSTGYDFFIFQRHKDKRLNVFVAFSFYTNGKHLLSIEHTDDSNITCLYGLRVISMVWIIFSHSYLMYIFLSKANTVYLFEWIKNDTTVFIMGAIACVDTFLLISGFLIVYIVMTAKERETPINLFVFYVHRILRLTPALAAIILVYVGIVVRLGSGPIWYYVDLVFKDPCLKNWWITLLYVQNYLNVDYQCVLQSWYLAVDTQLYILSPLLFIPLQKWTKATTALITMLIVANIFANIYTTYYYNMDNINLGNVLTYFSKIYIPTHLRAAPWLIGIIFGYAMFKLKNKKIIIKKIYVIILWITALTSMAVISYGYVANSKYKTTVLMVALFNGFSRLIWGLCICWIIFACVHGYGGLIHKFLSLSVFRVLSRLTYSFYLTNFLIMFMIHFQTRTHTYVGNTYQLCFRCITFGGNYIFSLGLSLVWTLIFESPVAILENTFTKRGSELRRTRELKIDNSSESVDP